MPIEPLAQSIITFWFGDISPEGQVPKEISARWFKKDADFDQTIAQKFGSYMDPASWGAFDRWSLTPDGLTALIVLLDQFPRNLYRSQAKSFYFDQKALSFARQAVESKTFLEAVPTVMGYFQIMPFMHSESLQDQDQAIKAFEALLSNSQPGAKDMIASALKYSYAHRDIIAKFGRFPHRNDILGRTSTPEEVAFLKTPGSSF